MISKICDRHRYRSMRGMRKAYAGCAQFFYAKHSVISLPENIELERDDNRQALLKTIESVHEHCAANHKICLDFSATKRVYVSGMIMLFAELHNLKNIRPELKLKCRISHASKVNHVLNQIGLFKLCGYKFTNVQKFKDVIYWKVCHGTKAISEKYDEIVDEKYREIFAEADTYRACVEATINVSKHAYIEQRKLSHVDIEKTAWWSFTQIKDGTFFIAICDLGIGIPATLQKKHKSLFELLKTLRRNKDSDILKITVDKGESRTGLEYRGNGIPNMALTARNTPGAKMTIFSSRGVITVDNHDFYTKDYRRGIPGTIVLWSFPLETSHA